MTLRLSEEVTEALRQQAEAEHRSIQDVAQRAIREYIEGNRHRAVVDSETMLAVTDYAEALSELADR